MTTNPTQSFTITIPTDPEVRAWTPDTLREALEAFGFDGVTVSAPGPLFPSWTRAGVVFTLTASRAHDGTARFTLTSQAAGCPPVAVFTDLPWPSAYQAVRPPEGVSVEQTLRAALDAIPAPA